MALLTPWRTPWKTLCRIGDEHEYNNYIMKRFLFFALAVIMFAACSKDAINEQQSIQNIVDEAPETITVGFEGDETRIQLNSAQKTVWTKDDLVSVFYRSNSNQQWKYDGETGARTAELKRVDAGTATRDMDRVVVVYPYNNDYYINPETYNVQASLPAVQNYLKDSYGTNGNIMISSSEYNQFSLKSVCGWLKLQLTGDGEVVKSITLRGNNGEQVAGELYINSADATSILASESGATDDDSEAGGSLIFEDTILKEVTLDCGEGVELGAEATAFYIALPPQTFEKGFTVEIEDTEGYVMEQSTDKALTIERNHIQPMAAFEFINPATPSAPAPASNEIWYTATEKADPYFDDFLTFGSNVDSNVWDSETKRGIITFDGDVTMIGDDAFNNCDKFTGITLPECVTSIGKMAFYDCDGLTEFTIPNSVTEIGDYAFYGCSSLTSVTIPDSVTTIGENAFRYCDSLTSVTIPDSVTSIENSAFNGCTSLTSVNIPDSVTTIGDAAFQYCSSLTSVTIGDSVTEIGNNAFSSCYSLTEFTGKFAEDNGRILVVDGVLTAFAPAGITEYNIPDSVTTIGYAAFAVCTSLTIVTIGDSVTTIGEDAFYWCKSLTSVTIGDSVTSIGKGAFESCDSLKKVYCYATIPPSLGSDAFFNNASGRRIYVYEECVELYKSAWSSYKDSIYTNGQNCPDTTTIEYTTNDGNTITLSKLPIISNIYENGVGTLVFSGKEIPSSAFRECTNLTSVTIPDSVTTIGESAFLYCTSLTSVTIPDSVKTIGNYAFEDCESLTSVTIGDSVTTIGEGAFWGCSSLTSVTIPDSVTTIGWWAFKYCESLTSVTIPDSVTTIGYSAFENCTSLKEFTGKFATEDGRSLIMDNEIIAYANASGTTYTIPDSVTTIGRYAFSYCNSLTSVTIPDSVTAIGIYTFYNCKSLTSIIIPDSVTTIGHHAFSYCDSLTSVYCKATTPPAFDWGVFDNNGSGRKIYVPAGSVDAYKSAKRWSEYASAIVGYDFETGVVVE